MADELKAFEREDRYIVVKRKTMHSEHEMELCAFLTERNIATVECVVVESDWPEYETVWQMIEARVTGNARAAIAATGLVEEVERLRGVMEQAHDTLDQVLDDMRDDGLSVCRAVKQEIQETFETVAKALAEKPDAD